MEKKTFFILVLNLRTFSADRREMLPNDRKYSIECRPSFEIYANGVGMKYQSKHCATSSYHKLTVLTVVLGLSVDQPDSAHGC